MTTPRLRTSERVTFRRCQAKWKWAYVDCLQPRYPKPGALWFGTGIHLALQERYKYPGKRRGTDVLKVWREYAADTEAVIYGAEYDTDPEKFWKAADLGELMLGAYLDKYGKDEQWDIIAPEVAVEWPIFALTKLRSTKTGRSRLVENRSNPPVVEYLAAFDIVARNEETGGSLWLWDHKTAAAITTGHLALDDQAGSYWAIAGDVLASMGLVPPGTKLDGILYNFLRKAAPDPRPVNEEGLATNKPLKSHYFDALSGQPDGPGPAALARMKVDDLAALAERLGVPVVGEVSKRQPLPNFHRETVWRTPSERKTQIQRIRNEVVQMTAVRSGRLPIVKNPTKDCQYDCQFKEMCELHETGDRSSYREYRAAAFVKGDPYGDHYNVADEAPGDAVR